MESTHRAIERTLSNCAICNKLLNRLPGNLCKDCFTKATSGFRPPAACVQADFELGTQDNMPRVVL